VGARDFRTEDRFERLDVKYIQAILTVDGLNDVPIGLMVICEREDLQKPAEPTVPEDGESSAVEP
jgi:hypothetical protein